MDFDFTAYHVRKTWNLSPSAVPGARPETLVFSVVETKTGWEFTVRRSGLSWSCDSCKHMVCDHIKRAIIYYSNMKEMGEAPESPAIILDNPPRRIKVGE